MTQAEKIICSSCGFANNPPVANGRCASCGAKIEDLRHKASQREEIERRFRQEGFSPLWFGIAFAVMAIMTSALVMGLPIVIPPLDFEGSAGMLVSIPVWFLGGLLIGLISPGRTYIEPMAAVFLVAVPTAFILHFNQTVKTMPAFMYVLMSAVGMLFTLIGSYLGERIQLGPSAPTNE
jgi:cation transport ATPase